MTYTDDNRGKIQYRNRRKQLIDFSGLRIGDITPTDCDGIIEYHDKGHVFFEIKSRNVDIPKGQKLAFERTCNDFNRLKKPAVFIVAEHDVDDPAEDIDAAQCKVREFYFRGGWYRDKSLLKDLIERFIKFADGEKP